MKKIGIVGGVSWFSTVEYYKIICQLSHQHQLGKGRQGPPGIPEMSIESLNINKSFNNRGVIGDEGTWRSFDAYFRTALKRLEKSGADFAIIASNTPHNRYEAITRGIDLPVLSIFEVVAAECARLGARKVMILGTAPTMDSPIFPAVLSKHGIVGSMPESAYDKSIIIDLIDELQAGQNNGAAERIRNLVENSSCADSDGRRVVCLSCTELPLAFAEFTDVATFEVGGVLYVNTTVLHAKAAFDYAVSSDDG